MSNRIVFAELNPEKVSGTKHLYRFGNSSSKANEYFVTIDTMSADMIETRSPETLPYPSHKYTTHFKKYNLTYTAESFLRLRLDKGKLSWQNGENKISPEHAVEHFEDVHNLKTEERRLFSHHASLPLYQWNVLEGWSESYSTKLNAELFMLWSMIQQFHKLDTVQTKLNFGSIPSDYLVAYMMFPGLRAFQNKTFVPSPEIFKQPMWLGDPEINRFVENNFGQKALNENFLSLLLTLNNTNEIYTLSCMKDLVPMNWYLTIMEDLTNPYPSLAFTRAMKELPGFDFSSMLSLISPYARRKLLFATKEESYEQENFTDIIENLSYDSSNLTSEQTQQISENLDSTTWVDLYKTFYNSYYNK